MASRHAPGNLPADLSSFVGRRNDAHELRRLLSQVRLATLTGPGGVGKSRLALRVATQLQRTFRDGAWLVELAAISDPSLLPEAVAGALRVPERAKRDPREALSTYLADRHLLVVLDNCEHLRDASAALLAEVLTHAPGLRVLATSQEVLGLPGEAVYRLGPLAVPSAREDVQQAEVSPAVALFADRAANAMTGFRVAAGNVDAVMELCRRLDGMPLAIELAAAHTRFLTPAQILERIDDRFQLLSTKGSSAVPTRHHSLKAAVEWSYDLCTKPERLVWNRLSVFPATFDLPAAEAVCAGAGLTRTEVAEALAGLVDRSVLVSEPRAWGMRYRLLDTIREYGQRKLAESDESEHAVPETVLRSRHLDCYAALADEFDSQWFGPGQQDWLERLHTELPNIRSALAFAGEHPERAETGLGLVGNLGFFWRVSAMREGQTWLSRLIEAEATPSPARARALVALAWILAARAHQEGHAVVSAALMITEDLDPERVPRALFIRGTLMSHQDPGKARAVLEEAVAAAERVGSTADQAYALFGLAQSLGLAGEPDVAEATFLASRAICESTDELWWQGVINFRRSLIAWIHGDLDRMRTAATDALRASRLIPDLLTCADAVAVIAVAQLGTNSRQSAYLLGAAERYWEDAGGSVVCTPPWAPLLKQAHERCRAAIGSVNFDDRYQRGRNGQLQETLALVLGERRQQTKQQPEQRDFGLTRRELEVVDLISQGMTNKEIASRLVISARTVETHVQNILTKTGFSTRSQVAAWYAGTQKYSGR